MKRAYVVMAAMLLLGLSGAAMAVDINGGLSWGGWTLRGSSNDLGIYGRGTTDNPYGVYTTVFTYNNDPITGSPTGGSGQGAVGIFGGGFASGDIVIGVGVKMLAGESVSSFLPTLKFDLGNDSYKPSTTAVAPGDGQTSGSTWAHAGDFNMNANVGNGWRPGDLAIYNGSGGYQSGGVINNLNVPLASFAQADSYQLFVNISRVSDFAATTGYVTAIPAFGSDLTLCLNGYGNNNVVVSGVPTSPQTAVPEPATIILGAMGLSSIAGIRRFRRK